MFDGRFEAYQPGMLHETDDVAEKVRELLGFYESPRSEADAPGPLSLEERVGVR
jgi:hypothetical protein